MGAFILIGQAPAARKGWHDAPLSEGVGRRISALFGCEHNEYLRYTQRLNVFEYWPGHSKKGDKFPIVIARMNACRIRFSLGNCAVLFVGVGTAKAFGITEKIMMWRNYATGRINGEQFQGAILPHPSGVNRWWNSKVNRAKAQRFMHRAWKHIVMQRSTQRRSK
jgi:uracil-DNA glycosylase